MKGYNRSIDDVVHDLKTDSNDGLTSEIAKQRLAENGFNQLQEGKKKTNLEKFVDQFKDAMIIILLIAAAISFGLAFQEEDASAFFEPFLILLIVVLNAIMGVFQENKAERSLEALMSLSSPHARVIRDKKEQVIAANELVVGDLIKIEAGDFVPADARLITSSSLQSEESALTGESLPVDKKADVVIEDNAPIGDRINMIYSGCSITYGTGLAIVTHTGMHTEMGKIAGLLNNEIDTKTPLQEKLAELGRLLGIMAIVICMIIFIIGLIDGISWIEIFMTSVSLAVSAIPEGLPVIVTIVLSIGVGKMSKRNAIVKKLPAVETLGSTSVICSDKTGTLTQNKMTLVKAFTDAKILEDISDHNTNDIVELLKYGTLCSNGSVNHIDGQDVHIGDPTETSIIAACMKNHIHIEELNKQYPRVLELPFDSERKLMSVIVKKDNRFLVITKGACDELMKRCHQGDLDNAIMMSEELSRHALRVIAVAYKYIDEIPSDPTIENIENRLTFMGLVGMIDPPRQEAKEAVSTCLKAGIKPIMITGDHIVTACAIAKELGILQDGDEAITGNELSMLSDQQLEERIQNISVYARVSPEDKIRVVKAWQKQKAIVSMTGDGVNDAPALKASDIGCAMGITGTDVAKGAADLTLMDDNFATIVEAVKEGRGIYQNIRKTIGYLLGTNIGEVLVVFISMLIFKQAPLLSMQLLWINLVTDSLPAIALGMEEIEDDVMNEPPRHKDESIFAHRLGARIIIQGLLFGGLSLFAFYYGKTSLNSLEAGRTLCFMVLALSQVFQSYNMRSNKSLFKIGILTNPMLNKAALISFALVAIVLFIPPISTLFALTSLPMQHYIIGLGLSMSPILFIEILKATHIVH
ncbi:cation-translocating P-type ATPase [Candidatus Stoquefichus massiliensis]|uniref:cation-translocating P-type ATPase n=1 Tax=Candidatus Stoquefichus massiliensis TaxID=1470350 RepID=UPI00047F508F|nr:cation-translocating P-type ATPase [Candidatus Stoquefichus massiliensis]